MATTASQMSAGLSALLEDKIVAVALPRPGTAESLQALRVRDVLLLESEGPAEPQRESGCVRCRYRRPSDLVRTNAQVAILNGASAMATFNKRFFGRFEHLLVPASGTARMAALPGLMRYRGKSRLKSLGRLELGIGGGRETYEVLACNASLRNTRRLYGPTGVAPLDILRAIEPVDYVTLRWIEDIEAGRHEGDIDILVRGTSLDTLKQLLRQRAGTYPIDVYTDDGRDGHTYKSVPYFVPAMSRKILDTAELRRSGVRGPSPKWRYLLFCYHLLFQNKSETVPAGQEQLAEGIFPAPKYLKELRRLAAAAGRPEPRSFSDLEQALAAEDVLPGTDLIGFYSVRNPFLKARYLAKAKAKPGLAVFYVRDFGEGTGPVDAVRRTLAAAFDILAEGPVTAGQRQAVMQNVRGGNWYDAKAAAGEAPPVHWFVCLDKSPKRPGFFARRKYPRLDNENIRLKDDIREAVGQAEGKPLRVVHSSDNSEEAMEHLKHLGLAGRPDIAAIVRANVVGG